MEGRSIAAWLPLREMADREPAPLETEISALFDELRAPLFRYTLSLGLSPSDGEDIVQEVFLSLFRHLLREKSRTHVRGWIFRVGHNLALKRRRNVGRNAPVPPGDLTWVDPAPNPEEQVALLRRRERLVAVVRVLPERDRCCLYLRAEGLRYREIAETLDVSLGWVALSLGRSLARLSSVDQR